MHITLTTIAASQDARQVERYRVHMKGLTRSYKASELTVLDIEYLDDLNNTLSIWSDVQAAQIIVCLLSEDCLSAIDDLTDLQSGNNLIAQELLAKRADRGYRVVPVILNDCTWDTEGSIFQGLTGTPYKSTIAAFANKDTAWSTVTNELRQVIRELQKQASQPPTPVVPVYSPKQTTVIPPTTSACPRCGAVVAPRAQFCRSCGSALFQTPAPIVHQPQPPIVLRQPAQPQPQRISSQRVLQDAEVLVAYSQKDYTVAKQCESFLTATGVSFHDVYDVLAGENPLTIFTVMLKHSKRGLFLISADFLSEMYTKPDSKQALCNQLMSPQMMMKSIAAVIRPCYYKDVFSNAQPITLLALDGQPFASSRKAQDSWTKLAVDLKNHTI